MVEYTDPNPFKPFHIGHLMTNAIGVNGENPRTLGATVSRANYQGMWACMWRKLFGVYENEDYQTRFFNSLRKQIT